MNTKNLTSTLNVFDRKYQIHSINQAIDAYKLPSLHDLPVSLKILLENLLRHMHGSHVQAADIEAMAVWAKNKHSEHEIAYHPARVLMQDFTGVPAIVDLAAMRDCMQALGGDPDKINPQCPVDLVIDHSVQVDQYGIHSAFKKNVAMEMQRNQARYQFLKWGQQAFSNFRVVPPGTGICHQVNLEYLASVVCIQESSDINIAFPDTLVGTDSHTTMINGLGVLGWGVGGIEAEAAMLGQPISMLIPDVVGFRLTGKLAEGVTATDMVLTITSMLRAHGVVGKFVEFFGPGLTQLNVAERATIANMAPEYGATCGFFPIDEETIIYLSLTGRSLEQTQLVSAYAKQQGLWHDPNLPSSTFTDCLSLDLASITPCLAGPKRPQDKVSLSALPTSTDESIDKLGENNTKRYPVIGKDYTLGGGDVVIAAITSCTNTSNPSVLIGAGLLAKKAVAKGLQTKPWVKTSLAPGSKVVMDYLAKLDLIKPLEALGFYLVGYGCTTCIGNSGPLPDEISKAVKEHDLVVSSVLSGNRNFEGRVHPQTQLNWLASPPLVVAFALAGSTKIDLNTQPLTHDKDNNPIYLKDLWPSNQEISKAMQAVHKLMFTQGYADVFTGDESWQSLETTSSLAYNWSETSTYVQQPDFFTDMSMQPKPMQDIYKAGILAILGDSVTTDHISPAGAIKADSPAGEYLQANGVEPQDFNSYGSRRGNHNVMTRGTFANIRIRNEMLTDIQGGFTRHYPSAVQMSIYQAAMQYQAESVPLLVIAGKEYGTGSSRDWAAKGTLLLGVKAVIAESYERIHRSNLIGMGVLPCQFVDNLDRKKLALSGSEKLDLVGIANIQQPGEYINLIIHRQNGEKQQVKLLCRIDTMNELKYYQNQGILSYMIRQLRAED